MDKGITDPLRVTIGVDMNLRRIRSHLAPLLAHGKPFGSLCVRQYFIVEATYLDCLWDEDRRQFMPAFWLIQPGPA